MKQISNRCLLPCGLVMGILAIAAAAPLRADTITPPAYLLNCKGTNTTSEGEASCAGGTVGAFDEPYAEAIADFTSSGGNTSGSAQLTYYIDVLGGNPGDQVPIDVDSRLFTDAGGSTGSDVISSLASIRLEFGNGTYDLLQSVTCGNVLRSANSCSNPVWSGTLEETGVAGSFNKVVLVASVSISGSGFGDASSDPHFYIDPAFAAANPQYSIQLNVSNDLPSGAPEPATWMLGVAGMAIVGYTRFASARLAR